MNNKVNIIMYHYTRDLAHSRYQYIRGLDRDMFVQQIDFLKENFSIITMETLIECIINNSIDQLPENATLLTFDDGYIDNYTVALPILKDRGIQGSFFIPGKTFKDHKLLDVNKIHFILASSESRKIADDLTDLVDEFGAEYGLKKKALELRNEIDLTDRFDDEDTVYIKRMLQTILPEHMRNRISSILFERCVGISEQVFAYELYMNPDQIKCMKDSGMFIGIHGYDHYWLANVSKEQMKKDVDMALEALDDYIDRNCWVMNYPYGSYNTEVIEYIKSRGAVLGLCTEVRPANIVCDNRYALPRFDCNDFPPKSETYKLYGT